MFTREKLKQIAADGADIGISILEMVKEVSDPLPPLKAAASGALFLAYKVEGFRDGNHAWKDFGRHITEMVGEVVLRWEVLRQSGSEEGLELWKENIGELERVLEQIKKKVVERESQPWRIASLVRDDKEKIDEMRRDLDDVLRKFQLQTDIAIGHSLAWVVTNVQMILSNLKSIGVQLYDVENDATIGKLELAPHACYNSSEICLSGTRTKLARDIMAWCRDVDHHWRAQVTLLTGVAGAGKSTISHTIAHRCDQRNTLLSSFFFKAGITSRPDRLWSGVARFLAVKSEEYRATLTSILKQHPDLPNATFDVQFKRLILEPLRGRSSPIGAPLIIVIDALDECDESQLCKLAHLIQNEVPKLPPFIKFFVTSRDHKIVERCLIQNSSSIHHISIDLSDDKNLRDCELYIRSRVSGLKKFFPGISRDKLSDLRRMLVTHAGGLFVWVSIVVEYLRYESVGPLAALEDLLDQGSCRDDVPSEDKLDALYTAILGKCSWRDKSFRHGYPIVMGAIVAAKSPLSITAWDALLSPFLKPANTSVGEIISELRPLLVGTRQSTSPIQLLHQSFRDYLKYRRARYLPSSSAQHFSSELDSPRDQERLALRCFEVTNTELPDLTGLGVIKKLGEKDPMPTMSLENVPEQLVYACRFGQEHAQEVRDVQDALEKEIQKFLERSIANWMEFCVRTGRYVSIRPFFEWVKSRWGHLLTSSIKENSASSLTEIGSCLSFILRTVEARDSLIDSVSLWRELVAPDPAPPQFILALAYALRILGTRHLHLNQHMEARKVLVESISRYESLDSRDPVLYKAGLASALSNLGVCGSDLTESRDVIQKAVSIYRSLVSMNPASAFYRGELARTLNNLGSRLYNMGQYKESADSVKESVSLFRSLASEDPAFYSAELAGALVNLGSILNGLGRRTESLEVTQESITLWRSLASKNPKSYSGDLPILLGSHGAILANLGRYEESVKIFREAIELSRSLVPEDPATYKRYLASNLEKLGLCLGKLNQHTECLDSLKESFSLYKSLVSENPGLLDAEFADVANRISGCLLHLGRKREAFKVLRESAIVRGS